MEMLKFRVSLPAFTMKFESLALYLTVEFTIANIQHFEPHLRIISDTPYLSIAPAHIVGTPKL